MLAGRGMGARYVRSLLIVLGLGLALALNPFGAGDVRADDPPVTSAMSGRVVTLTALTPLSNPLNGTWTLSVRVNGSDGTPKAGEPVRFFMMAPFLGGRLIDLGEAVTDGSGIASLVYEPSWKGSHTAVFRLDSDGGAEPLSTTLHFDSDMPVEEHEDASFGIEPIRQWLPAGAILIVLLVWATLGYAVGSTVVGILAEGEQAPWARAGGLRVVKGVPQTSRAAKTVIALLVVALVMAVPVALILPTRGGPEPAAYRPDGIQVGDVGSGEVFPATLVRAVDTQLDGAKDRTRANSASLPADLAFVGDRLYILDTGNGRIMALSPDDVLTPTLESTHLGDIFFKGAVAMASWKGRLFVANQVEGNILEVEPPGKLLRTIEPQVPEAAANLRPSGIVMTEDGGMWVSDEANHRVLRLDREGRYVGMIGLGKAGSGPDAFNEPGGLALDDFGNVFVVDRGNHVVKKYSPLGVFLETFGEGVLENPQGVAVDEEGHVLVSDTGLVTVLVFNREGAYLGCVGAKSCSPENPEHYFRVPYGLEVHDGLLYVMDRLSGILAWRLEGGGTER